MKDELIEKFIKEQFNPEWTYEYVNSFTLKFTDTVGESGKICNFFGRLYLYIDNKLFDVYEYKEDYYRKKWHFVTIPKNKLNDYGF